MSDKNAESPTITRDIKNIIYKAARQAMHPARRKIIWTGTPFNKRDPLYEAASSGSAWNVRVYPICEKFPVSREEFRGAWEDRFPYEFVNKEYESLLANGEIEAFDQELMLRISSEEGRLVQDGDIMEYDNRASIISNRSRYNFYITTDFATSETQGSDYSVISVWAYNNNGDWLWVDGVCKRQLMDKNVDDLFRLVSVYKPMSVGIEVTGQQGGFIQWIQQEMLTRNVFFNMASENNSNKPGIRPTTNKMQRFNTVLPLFKQKKIWFPRELKNTVELQEIYDELKSASRTGFKSKHDDAVDTISMLSVMGAFKPSAEAPMQFNADNNVWESPEVEDEDFMGNSTVF
jgi:predicted phage terminase large subunit-like protein